jgi:hypothetical protein
MTRVLILGGYGNFGGRLARLLADDARLTLLIAGRSHERAKIFCAGLGGVAKLEPHGFDRDGSPRGCIARAGCCAGESIAAACSSPSPAPRRPAAGLPANGI